jgi:hypothetical protein
VEGQILETVDNQFQPVVPTISSETVSGYGQNPKYTKLREEEEKEPLLLYLVMVLPAPSVFVSLDNCNLALHHCFGS